ncbi:MAG: GNAT family N-acetyltransferase [Cyanobacteria bacterium P01_F01_bin.56]
MATLNASTKWLADGTPVTLRSAAVTDAEATLALFRSIVEEGQYTLAEPAELTQTLAAEQAAIAADQDAPSDLCLVATVDEQVVGMVRATAGSYRRTQHFADIDSMWVAQSWRGRGVAHALMKTLITWAEQHEHLEKLGLFVFSSNRRAIRFYEKHGFIIEGRYARDMKLSDREYVDTIAMGQLIKPRCTSLAASMATAVD